MEKVIHDRTGCGQPTDTVHVRHSQKSRGFSGVSAAASSGGPFIHSLLTRGKLAPGHRVLEIPRHRENVLLAKHISDQLHADRQAVW